MGGAPTFVTLLLGGCHLGRCPVHHLTVRCV